MATLTLTKGANSRSIELLDTIKHADAINVHIGDKYAELTTDVSFAGDTPRLKFSKNGVDYFVREKFTPPLPPPHTDGVGDLIVTPSGRSLQRHSSGDATIVTWYNYSKEQYESFAVLDAQYRTVTREDWGNVEVDLPGYTCKNTNNYWGIDGTDEMNSDTDWPFALTDQELYDIWSPVFDVNTARYNTNVLATHPECNHAHLCRAQMLDGVPCDFPTITQLLVIALEADQIDALDPTLSTNAQCAFGSQGAYSYMGYSNTSSTRYYYVYEWNPDIAGRPEGGLVYHCIYLDGWRKCLEAAQCFNYNDNMQYQISPILEL